MRITVLWLFKQNVQCQCVHLHQCYIGPHQPEVWDPGTEIQWMKKYEERYIWRGAYPCQKGVSGENEITINYWLSHYLQNAQLHVFLQCQMKYYLQNAQWHIFFAMSNDLKKMISPPLEDRACWEGRLASPWGKSRFPGGNLWNILEIWLNIQIASNG